ncbi:MAG: DUF2207 domain-containing protein [Candidatus Obscuribacter sp.]|nr:DUF2207 domain-containing protein [Candidatus Obscuribacter sp.]
MLAQPAKAEDIVSSIDMEARAERDSTVVVKEQISVKFDGKSRFFERTIPLVSPDGPFVSKDGVKQGAIRHLGFRLIKVSGQKGPCYYQIKSGANAAVLRIGEPGKTLSGSKQYTVEYLLRRAFDFGDERATLPFYVLRADNPYRVDYLSTRLVLPQKVLPAKLDGSIEVPNSAGSKPTWQSRVDKSDGLLMFTVSDLPAGTACVFRAGLPAQVLDKPSWLQSAGQFAVDWYPLFFLPALTIFAILATWFNFGLRPLAGYQPLSADAAGFWLAPIELAALLRGRTDKRDIALCLLDLARRGFLQVFAIDTDGAGLALKRRFAFSSEISGDGLQRTIDDEQLASYEREILEHLFTDGSGQHPLMIDDFASAAPRLGNAWDSINKHIFDKEIFWGRPGSFGYAALTMGILMIVLGLIMTSAFAYQPAGPWGLGLVASGIVSLVMARLMPVYTVRGLKMRASARAALKAHGITDGDKLPDDKLPMQWHLELSGQNLQSQLPWCNMTGGDPQSVSKGLSAVVDKLNDALAPLP